MPPVVCQSWFQRIARPEKLLTDPSDGLMRWGILLLSVLALTLRLIQLGAESLWFDEAFSIRMATLPLGELLPTIRREDFNPPLYYLILHGWIRWFGDSEWVLRLFAVLCGTLSIPLAYRLGKDLLGKTAALWAAFLMTLSVYHIYFSQQVRGYTLFALLTWISMILFFRLLDRPSVRVVFGYCGVTMLALYCHPFGVIHVLAQNVMFGVLVIRESTIRQRWRLWLGVQGILAIAFTPWISATLWISRKVTVMSQDMSLFMLAIWDLPGALKAIAGDADYIRSGSGDRYWIGGLFVLLSLVAVAKPRSSILKTGSDCPPPQAGASSPIRSQGLVLTIVWLLTVWLIPYLISIVAVPMFASRYLISVSLAFFLLVGSGISMIPWRFLRITTGLFVVCTSLITLVPYYAGERNAPWREVASYIESRARPGDLSLFHAPYYNTSIYWYYAKRNDIRRVGFPSGGDPDYVDAGIVDQQLVPLIHSYNRIWLILCNSHDRDNLIQSTLGRSFRLTDQRKFFRVEIFLYERQPQTNPANLSDP
jgi:mannosyltransferase